MTSSLAASILLIALPIAFNAAFAGLAKTFDYPNILRRPTGEILARFREGGAGLVLLWWGFAMTAVLFAPLAVLLASALEGADPVLLTIGAAVGVLAAAVQFLGLIRWPFLVPYLARVAESEAPESPRGQAVDVVFQSFNRYLGVAVGEHLGYAFTGVWSSLTGVAMLDSAAVPDWLGVVGLVAGPLFVLCSLEFVGRNEESGWKLAGALTPITYIVWSVWLLAVGVALLV